MLTSDRGLVLRPIEATDIEFVLSLRNDLAIQRLASQSPPMPHVRQEIEANMANPATRLACSAGAADSLEFLCEIDGAPAGVGGLYDIHHWARHAELGVSLAAGPWRRQGFGELAHRMLIEYGFDDLNLRRIVASVHGDNAPVLRLCDKLGFQREGVRKEFRWVNGRYVDLVLFSMSRVDYADERAEELDVER